jgi:hypothetical protein
MRSEVVDIALMVSYWCVVYNFAEKYAGVKIVYPEEQSHALINRIYEAYGELRGE